MRARIDLVLGAALLSLTATGAFAGSCGTVASPTLCSLDINGNTRLILSNFNIGNTTGDRPYQEADIAIDFSSAGGTLALLTFTKDPNGPTAGSTFFVNSGETSGFILTYKAVLSALLPGTVAFTGAQVSFQDSHVGTGFGSLQLTNLSSSPCQATTTSGLPVDCVLRTDLGTTVVGIGDIMSLSGNTSGNVAFNQLRNRFDTSFTADPVPEPATVGLVGLSFGLLLLRRRQ